MNKKLIIISVILSAAILGLGIFSYLYNRAPAGITQTVTKMAEDETTEVNNYLTDNFINRINNESPSSKEFLDSNVENYSVNKSIKSTKTISVSENQATVETIVRITTINTKTKFEVVTLDTYRVSLLKENGDWKIDEYTLTESKTETN